MTTNVYVDGFNLYYGAAAAACIPAAPVVRIALVVSVTAGIACGGLWVWRKEPRNRTPEPGRS